MNTSRSLIIRPDFVLVSHRLNSPELLNELLFGMRLSSVQFRRIALGPVNGIGFTNPIGRAQFHFVARGPVWLRSPGNTIHLLDAGDALLIPRGGHHAMLPSPDIASSLINSFDPKVENAPGANAPPNGALIFSGCMELELGGMQPLIAAMPETMLVATLLQVAPEVVPMLEAMEREARAEQAGQANIMARLAEVVASLIVRGWATSGCSSADGWVGALHDPRLSRAIFVMHKNPGHNWTVADLARESGSSRSVFAERFLKATGVTPLRYLTELRMRLAVHRLSHDKQPIKTVASELGYGSLAAFSRAFKRTVGVQPGALRTAQIPAK